VRFRVEGPAHKEDRIDWKTVEWRGLAWNADEYGVKPWFLAATDRQIKLEKRKTRNPPTWGWWH